MLSTVTTYCDVPMKKLFITFLITILLFAMISSAHTFFVNPTGDINFDPLVDIEVTVEIQAIRYFEDDITQLTQGISNAKRRIRLFQEHVTWQLTKDNVVENKPNMYVKIFINDEAFVSPVYPDTYYVYEPNFSATLNVPNTIEFVEITIELWDLNENGDKPSDISPTTGKYTAHMVYSIATGHWTGDDYLGDPSGYGRLNGCDDGSMYRTEGDCELWFDIFQTDHDGDGIPYWMEVNVYGTDPTVDDTGIDYSGDGIPIEWEWKFGYCPNTWYDHLNLDPSGDGISNYEKYLTWGYGSDPFRKEVFVQMDIMAEGPNGEHTCFPNHALELLYTAFNRQNIVLHIDTGGTIPFFNEPDTSQIRDMYDNYFIRNEEERWREDVFHYGLILYNVRGNTPPGFAYRRNAFIVAGQGMEEKSKNPFAGSIDVIYASAFMHELGHTFGFRPIPGHNKRSIYYWQPLYWYNLAYNSCMNYGWMYQLVDYSDGSGPWPDRNDWERLNYRYFKTE